MKHTFHPAQLQITLLLSQVKCHTYPAVLVLFVLCGCLDLDETIDRPGGSHYPFQLFSYIFRFIITHIFAVLQKLTFMNILGLNMLLSRPKGQVLRASG